MVVDFSKYVKLSPKQKLAASHVGKGKIVFFGGAKYGGKSFLVRAVTMQAACMYPRIKILIACRHYPSLKQNFVIKFKEQYPQKIFQYRYLETEHTMRFANGSYISLFGFNHMKDMDKIQNQEYDLLCIDEAPQYDEDVLKLMLIQNRNTGITGFTSTTILTGNPGGRSHLYLKDRFIDPQPAKWTEAERQIADKYIFIQSLIDDNIGAGEENIKSYKEQLMVLDKDTQDALLYGKWNSFGGKFFKDFNYDTHTCDPFDIPSHWKRYVGFDLGWGNKNPSVALWVAQDPETLELFVYREWTGYQQNVADIATILRELSKDENIVSWVCDPALYKDRGAFSSGYAMGLPFLKGNNERVDGWRVLKQWFSVPVGQEYPMLRIFRTCPHSYSTIPTLEYNENLKYVKEDLNTRQKDDAADVLRYMVKQFFPFPSDFYKERLTVNRYQDTGIERTKNLMNELRGFYRRDEKRKTYTPLSRASYY